MRSWTGRLEDAEKHVATVDQLYLSTIGALSTAIEAKDGVTSSHIHRVQHYAMGLAQAIGGLDEQTMKAIEAAALLHDTGKLAVPERILNKPGKLTPAEFETMKLHVDVGADILSSIDFPYPVVPIVRAHHENWDGTGYPNGLKGFDIPIGARILSVVDCYDALTSDRPYRAAMTDERGAGDHPRAPRHHVRPRRGRHVRARVPRHRAADRQAATAEGHSADHARPSGGCPRAGPTCAGAATPPWPKVRIRCARSPISPASSAARPTATDVASMIWSHVRHVVPNASCAFFLNDPARDSVAVAFVAGEGSPALQGLEIKLGDRLTGWVAENQQPIINSEATLDLGSEAAFVGSAILPVVAARQRRTSGRRAVALQYRSLFTTEQAQTLQFVMPHLAVMFLAIESRADTSAITARANRCASSPAANAVHFQGRHFNRREQRHRAAAIVGAIHDGAIQVVLLRFASAPVPEHTSLTVPSALTRAATACQPRLMIGS